MSYLKCPNCSSELVKIGKTYTCAHKHAFDCAKSGYVNLLQSQKNSNKQHGDDLVMLHSRKNFLDKGYYQSLVDKISEIINQYPTTTLLDAGCGEGWYCENIKGTYNIYGIDISKQACDLSAKRNKTMTFAVGSTFDMPLVDNSMDLVYSVFAPFSAAEIHRILKQGGRFIYVYPLENHLLELKEAIYQKAYLNDVETKAFTGFKQIAQHDVLDVITLECNEDIQNLFSMTPYVHRTSKIEQKNLENLTTLQTQLAFGISEYVKQ